MTSNYDDEMMKLIEQLKESQQQTFDLIEVTEQNCLDFEQFAQLIGSIRSEQELHSPVEDAAIKLFALADS